MSYWWPHLFPLAAASGVLLPKTTLLRTQLDLSYALKTVRPVGWAAAWRTFVADVTRVASAFGAPYFLRTGLTAAKQAWADTCHVPQLADTEEHLEALVEAHVEHYRRAPSVWAVRELLPVTPEAVSVPLNDFPMVREVRAYVEGGAVICCHSFWVPSRIRKAVDASGTSPGPMMGLLNRLNMFDAPAAACAAEPVAVALARDGAWAVDLMETGRGWAVIDLEAAGRSPHYLRACPHAQRWNASVGQIP